jgi:Zn-finger nucleic acid-binding protein
MEGYRVNAARMCPRCGQHLVVEGPLHTCAGCGGAWLAEPVLDAALDAHEVADTAPPRRWLWWRRARLVCPVCGAALGLVISGAVHIDRCAEHGLWCDAGELARLLTAAGIDGVEGGDEVRTQQLLSVLRGAVHK